MPLTLAHSNRISEVLSLSGSLPTGGAPRFLGHVVEKFHCDVVLFKF
jgi:hypothetical protein